ncbi:MAG: bifunctional metallophosphatase/5'-nucleotidase, partial [Gammaproteobacteria bacterium]|nr:bifunctional metallophosphatase/5'-nucleotidase [Gammaproteobacteria bacterium]
MKVGKLFRRSILASAVATAAVTVTPAFAADENYDGDLKKIYIMHTGDLHGDLDTHPNARDDATGVLEGGLARAATVIKKLKKDHAGKIVWGHTGDTIQGSAIATYTQGKALVDVWDALAPDVFATGNWEYVYGLYRYQQLFGAEGDIRPIAPTEYSSMFMKPMDPSGQVYQGFNAKNAIMSDQNGEKRRWRTIAANAYYNGENPGPGVNTKAAGEYFTDPYYVQNVNGIRVGFLGCTTNRGPQVVSSNVTKGVTFTNCMGDVKFPQNKPIQWTSDDHPNRNKAKEVSVTNPAGAEVAPWGSTVGYQTVPEIVKFTEILRAAKDSDTKYINSQTGAPYKGEGVDLVVLMSEAGIPESVWNAEHAVMPEGVRFPEVVLSSDTHERTRQPVVVTNKDGNKTVVVEEGEDGMQVGLIELEFANGKLAGWDWTRYDIDETVAPDAEIADLIEDAKAPFMSAVAGGDWTEGDEFVNPFNGYTLTKPLDFQMASTQIVLERNRFSYEHEKDNLKMPADIEGTLHDVYTDAFRALTNADVGALRGFRYNNTIMPGPVTIDDVYHSLTIGAMVASGEIPSSPEAEAADVDGDGKGCFIGSVEVNHKKNDCHYMAWPRSLVQEMELSGNGTQQSNVPGWSGGWFFNYSGVNFDLDVYKPNFNKYGKGLRSRVTNVKLVNPKTGEAITDGSVGSLPPMVSYASYYYDADWNRINRNQVTSADKCAAWPSRSCADDKNMFILA